MKYIVTELCSTYFGNMQVAGSVGRFIGEEAARMCLVDLKREQDAGQRMHERVVIFGDATEIAL